MTKIEKTCYFCALFEHCPLGSPSRKVTDKMEFIPSADWIEIEKLQKENEELKLRICNIKKSIKSIRVSGGEVFESGAKQMKTLVLEILDEVKE